MRDHARVVVIGGGNMGASVLYHLAKEGWTDCVLLEKAELTSGATWHAAGLVSRMVTGHALGTIHDYAVDLYKTIEDVTEQSVSWHNCGSLRVATSEAHMDWIRHIKDCVLARGQEASIISPEEVQQLNPLYDVEKAGVLGAVYTPDDGHVDPAGTCFAMAKGARQLGAEVIRNCQVLNVSTTIDNKWAVTTKDGTIIAEHVVNAAGYHARQVGAMSGLDLPITTLMHHYIVTDNVPEFAAMQHEIPVTRDDYFCGYVRREQASALIGLYDKQAPQAVWLDGCPWDSENELFEANWNGIMPWLENCFERMPALTDRGIKRVVNGGITYTPDGAMLLGPAPELENYWLACGATVGIAWGPGAGKALAQWIVHGSADISTRAFDPRRFGKWANSEYAQERAKEDYTLRQAMPLPQHQRETKRNLVKSGAYEKAEELGATFEEAFGWERPRLYIAEALGWRRTHTFDIVGRECNTVRERVGLGDFSAFAKFEISGKGASNFLNLVCANKLPRPGRCALTLLLNQRGTIEGEATICCTGEDTYYFVTGAPSGRRVLNWLHKIKSNPAFQAVDINDVSERYGNLVVAGPHARDVLQKLTKDDIGNEAFPWMSAQHISIKKIPVLALRLSYTGELAFELHASNKRLGDLWQEIMAAGEEYHIGPFGSKALDSLRMEKFYRGGHELANDASHKDIDMMRFADLSKDFMGKIAMLERNPTHVLSLIALENEETEAIGSEAIFMGNKLVGSVTSSAYGHTIKKSLVMGFLNEDARKPNTELNVSIFDKRIAARVLPGIPWDPNNERIRA